MPIRPAVSTDAPAITAIFNQYIARATMVLQARPVADYEELLARKRTTAFVAISEAGKTTGFACVEPYSDRGGYVLAAVISIFLDGDQTGTGIGGQLYDQLLPAAHQLGYRHLTAKIWANNTGSIRFHQRHGFRLVGTQVGIGFVNGKRVDTVLMELGW
jgi:phosphinothricin acetyltransferase